MPRKITVNLQCSNCGAKKEIENLLVAAKAAIDSGWGSFGSALYCPECSRTWDSRNPGRPMWSEAHTLWVISNLIYIALKTENDIRAPRLTEAGADE